MKSREMGGSLAIVGVGVALGVISFVVEPLRFLLVLSLIITVIGGGIPFFNSLQQHR